MKGPVLVDPGNRDKLLDAARAAACRGDAHDGAVLALRAGGETVAGGRRAELLTKLAAGELVELEIEILAFEQKLGERNRKSVRFRDGALVGLGRSGKGTPFLRDHEQWDVLARGGTVLASTTEKVDEGHYRIHQTVKVTSPWAVEALLRGNIDRFSVGWNATGEVLCSACNKPVFSRCYHFPGDRLRELEEDGVKKLVRDRTGSVVVEWIYTEAELVETSAVSVPAVPSTQIEGIRAALSALDGSALKTDQGENPPEENTMQLKAVLATILGIAATASDDEVIEAVKSDRAKLNALDAQNTELRKAQAKSNAEAEALRLAAEQRELEEFITLGIEEGKIVPKSKQEESLRHFFNVDKEGAKQLLASSARITQAKAPRQSGGQDPTPAPGASTTLASVEQGLKEYGATPSGVRKVLAQLGSDPTKTLEKYGAQALGLTTTQPEG